MANIRDVKISVGYAIAGGEGNLLLFVARSNIVRCSLRRQPMIEILEILEFHEMKGKHIYVFAQASCKFASTRVVQSKPYFRAYGNARNVCTNSRRVVNKIVSKTSCFSTSPITNSL